MSSYNVKDADSGKSIQIIYNKGKVVVRVCPSFLLSVISILGEQYHKWYKGTEDKEVLEELNIIFKKMKPDFFLVNRFQEIKQKVLEEYGLDQIIISMNSSKLSKPEVNQAMDGIPRNFNISEFGDVKMTFDNSKKGARVRIYVESLANSDLSKISDEDGILTKLDDFWDKIIKNITDFIKSDDGKKSKFVEDGNKKSREYKKIKEKELEEKVQELDKLRKKIKSKEKELSENEKIKAEAEEKIATIQLNLKKLEKDLDDALTESEKKAMEDKKSEIAEAKYKLAALKLTLPNGPINNEPINNGPINNEPINNEPINNEPINNEDNLKQLDNADNTIHNAEKNLETYLETLREKYGKSDEFKNAKKELNKIKIFNHQQSLTIQKYNSEIEKLKLKEQNCSSEKSRLEEEIAFLK